jgi:hypothetical protein
MDTKIINKNKEESKNNKEKSAKQGILKNLTKPLTQKEITFFTAEIVIFFIFIIFLFSNNRNQRAKQEAVLRAVIKSPEQTKERGRTDFKKDSKEIQKEEFARAKKIDSSSWSAYSNNYHGFSVKYLPDWNRTILYKKNYNIKWEQRYGFRKKNLEEANPYSGFDITVYNARKISGLKEAEEFPALKEGVNLGVASCGNIEGYLTKDPELLAEEIYIPFASDCYKPRLFYSLVGNGYIYNIVPVYKESYQEASDPKEQTIKSFPEFFASVASFRLIDIVRAQPKSRLTAQLQAKPKPAPSRINAPRPIAETKNVNGKLFCAKKNDKPRKSKQHKGKHLDMECCLDPDEYPNPWCTY